MRRHISLQPLSRFHRSVLFLALILKKNPPKVKGYPDSWEDKVTYAKSFYESKLKPHFERIESKLIPEVINESDSLKEMSEVIIEKQQELGLWISNMNDQIGAINKVGDELEKHIRMLERQFFQEIQSVLGDEKLNTIVV